MTTKICALKNIVACVLLSIATAQGASILNQTTTESDARLVKTEGEPQEYGFRLTRCWAFIAGAAATNNTVAELMTNLSVVTTYTDPKANNKTYTGTFVSSKVWAKDETEDGTSDRHCTILQTLTQVRTVTSVADLGTPIKDADQVILNFGQFQEGMKYRVWHRYYNLNPANRAAIMALSPTESGYRLNKREFKTERDMTGTFICEFLIDSWFNMTGTTPNRVQAASNLYDMANYSPKNDLPGIMRRQTLGADGLTSNDVDEIMKNLSAASGWFMDNIVIAEKGNSEYGMRWGQTKARDTTEFVTTKFTAAWGTRPSEHEEVTWYLLTSNNATLIYNDAVANQAAMASATYRAAPAGHRLLDVQRVPGENGAYRVERVTWKPGSGATAWPENTTTYSNDVYNPIFSTTVTNHAILAWNHYFTLTKYEGTVDAAENNIISWQTTYGTTYGKSALVHRDVYHLGADRWRSQATFFHNIHTNLTNCAQENSP